LNFSALLRPGGARPVPAHWSLMAGVAVHEAAAAFLPDAAALMLKWPNDLMLGGAKLAGVLIDSALRADGTLDWVILGVGVNVAEAPALPDRPTTCLAAHGAAVAPRDLAGRLMDALDRWGAQDLAAIRAAWLDRAHPPGTPLRVQQGGRVLEGIFEGLEADGALKLRGHAPLRQGEVALGRSGEETPHAAGG
jgi:BirA family biotin operon repressor/biotin-[acetyl-CoA-carboxylase] ligase